MPVRVLHRKLVREDLALPRSNDRRSAEHGRATDSPARVRVFFSVSHDGTPAGFPRSLIPQFGMSCPLGASHDDLEWAVAISPVGQRYQERSWVVSRCKRGKSTGSKLQRRNGQQIQHPLNRPYIYPMLSKREDIPYVRTSRLFGQGRTLSPTLPTPGFIAFGVSLIQGVSERTIIHYL